MNLILLIVLLILIIGLLPAWPYSAGWGFGYYPSGGLMLVLIVLVILAAMGRL